MQDLRQQRGGNATGQGERLLSAEAMARNANTERYIRSFMSIVSGCAVGVLGLTGLQGFAAFALLHLVVTVALLAKMGFQLPRFSTASLPAFAFGSAFGELTSFVMFWTLLFALVHLY